MTKYKAKITKTKIEQLCIGDKLWDNEVTGLYVFRQKTKTSYYYKYRVGNKQKLSNLGSVGSIGLEDARTKARQYYVLSREGLDPELHFKQKAKERTVQAQKENYTIADAYKDWEAHYKPQLKKNSLAEWTLYGKYVAPRFASTPLKDIKPEEVSAFHRSIEKPYSANRSIKILKKLYDVAEDLSMYEGKRPFRLVKLHPEPKRKRHLTEDEPQRLYQALENYKHKGREEYKACCCVYLYLLTSARKSEWLNTPKAWVDLNQGVLRLPTTKNNEADEKILPRSAIEILRSLFELHPESEWVFPSPKRKGQPLENIKRHWKNIREIAQLKDFRLHDLRRSFASFGLTKGYSLEQIGEILNHKNVNTTKGYAYLLDTAKREATETIAKSIIITMQESVGV